MKAIVAVDNNWGIGFKGQLLQRIPEDMAFFRKTTAGHVVIMGRKTYESLPGRKPLVNRINIILTNDMTYSAQGAYVVHSVEELFGTLSGLACNSEFAEIARIEELFVIGGQQIYELLLPCCDEVLVTKILKSYEADAFFTNLDEHKDWELSLESAIMDHEGVGFKFCSYKKNV